MRAQLRRDGLAVSKKTVESSMARQGLQGRSPRRRRRGLTRPDKAAAPVADLLRRDFTADAPDHKWVGDFKQIDTAQGPVYLAPSRTSTRGACWASPPPTQPHCSMNAPLAAV